MSNYGIQPTGYVRKPLSVILAELEAAMGTQFGPGVIQTPQSPLGQLNGLMADLLAEIDERHLDLYQSYDPDQAEGTRLDTLARLRLLQRNGTPDENFRKLITNQGQARIDIQDLAAALSGLPGVTYARVFVNETGDVKDGNGLERGVVAVAVIGGDDELIADTLRRFIVPGVATYGNARVTTEVSGFCRSMSIIRPVEVEVQVAVNVRRFNDALNCPPPSAAAMKVALEAGWLAQRGNGQDVTAFTVRSILERNFSNVEVQSITAMRDNGEPDNSAPIDFLEIASLKATVVTS